MPLVLWMSTNVSNADFLYAKSEQPLPLWVMAVFSKNHTVKLSCYMYAHSH